MGSEIDTDLTSKCRILSLCAVFSFVAASTFTNKLISRRNAAFSNQNGMIC